MKVPIRNNFAELLAKKSEKENRFISIGEVAQAAGVSRKTLYKWEKNALTQYDSDTVDALLEYFGVSFHELLEHTPPSGNDKKSRK
jgi:predicted transcriptional regulator